jgi:SAM-dependent methyltransferase
MPESATARDGKEAHWDAVYRDHGTGGVSWFQPTPTVSIELIRRLEVAADAAILDVGGGASTLVDALIADGYRDLSVLDISDVALGAARQRLGAEAPITLIHVDLLAWTPERSFDLWHDRAVFHFLVEDRERRRYRDLMRQALRLGGHFIVATFASDGPQYCSGLPVARYTTEELSEVLGEGFEVLDHRREEHRTPTGSMQPFTWLAGRLQN